MPWWAWVLVVSVAIVLFVYWLYTSSHKAHLADMRNTEVIQEVGPFVTRIHLWINTLSEHSASPDMREQALGELTSIRNRLLEAHSRTDHVGRTYTDLWLQFSDVAIEMWQNAPYDSEHDAATWTRLQERHAALVQQADDIRSVPMGHLQHYARATHKDRRYP